MSALRVVRLLVVAALWVSLVVYAALVGHDFFHHADRSVWATTDDGEAGIVYTLATQARYAFLSSPDIEGMSRLHGQFNYGPWYFALGAGLTWLFGYSLTVIRSIHFWVVIATATAAAAWFRGRDRTAAPALVGFGFLYFFGTIEWPMARPDSLVTAFAVAMIVSAGLAMTRRRAGYWCLAGLAAACGAFTHLIAASLVPSAAIIFGVFGAIELRDTGDRPGTLRLLRRSALALAAGMAAGAAMFYASFGFDVAQQYRYLLGYRQLTARPDTYTQAIAKHFLSAFGSFPLEFRIVVIATLAAAWLMTIVVGRRTGRERAIVAAYLLPPATVWTLYFLTIGKYTNYHSGYAILHHAMFLWTAAAIVWVTLTLMAGRARLALIAGVVASSLVLAQGVRLAAREIAEPTRALAGERLVPFADYVNHVLAAIPARSTVWGTVTFGIESPDRVQLVQYSDAISLAVRVPPARRVKLAPDYIVWGYTESSETALEVLHHQTPSSMIGSHLGQVLPGVQFRLVSLTSGAPYGVTRVFARRTGAVESPSLPDVAVYDAPHRRWLTRIGAALPVTIEKIPPVTMHIGYERAPAASVAQTSFVTVLPAGAYLLRIAVVPGSGRSERRLIAAIDPERLNQTITEMGPEGEFVGYADGDRSVFALVSHRGGPLYINQFDEADGAGMGDVTVYPVHDLLDPDEHPSRSRPLPDFAGWTPMSGGVRVTARDGRLQVDGDATALGYQVASPVVLFNRDDRVELRVPSTIAAGRVCTGILDAGGTRWLVPADAWHEEMRFRGDGTGGFRVVFANCRRATDRPQPSRFEIARGSYVNDAPGLYSDVLTSLALDSKQPVASLQPADLHFVAPIVRHTAAGWTIDGQAEAKYSYLIQSKPRRLEAASRVLITGHITRGGLTVGLLKGDRWADQRNVDAEGDFRVVLEPASSGSYAIAIANFLGERLDTSIVIDHVDIYPAGLVPQS